MELNLKMPVQYANMHQEEMLYVDGGGEGVNGFSSHWWGASLKLSGSVMKKVMSYGVLGIASSGAAFIAEKLGIAASVSTPIGLILALNFAVIAIAHDGKHGVSFNFIGFPGVLGTIPWRQ